MRRLALQNFCNHFHFAAYWPRQIAKPTRKSQKENLTVTLSFSLHDKELKSCINEYCLGIISFLSDLLLLPIWVKWNCINV